MNNSNSDSNSNCNSIYLFGCLEFQTDEVYLFWFELAFNNAYTFTGTCPTGEYNFNPMTRRCVGLHKINLNWQDSKDFCESRGEYILALSSAEDAMQVVNIMQNYSEIYSIITYSICSSIMPRMM